MRMALGFIFFLSVSLGAAGSPPAYFADLLESARTDYVTNHLDSALTKLDQHDKAKGPDAESLDLRGEIALEQGKLAEAARAFNEAHELQPELFSPRLHLGDLFMREKKYAEARAVYQKLATETNVLVASERVRYGLLLTDLAAHDEAAAKRALDNIKFPTETPAYYFAQAAWEFAHGKERSARKWIATAQEIFEPNLISWFARPFYDLGRLKEKPPPPTL
jgi:tetratricopeptide (TPR) repeat protein